MKTLVFSVLLCLSIPAYAATTTESYLAERDQSIASLRPLADKANSADASMLAAQKLAERETQDPTEREARALAKREAEAVVGPADQELNKRDTQELAKLQTMIQSLVGPLRMPGFPPNGEISFDNLFVGGNTGWGHLDGLTVKSLDGKTTGLVTTEPLLRDWLLHSETWHYGHTRPTEPEAAFHDEWFYTEAIGGNAAAYIYADLPIVVEHGTARAILLRFAQDLVSPALPDQIAVAVAVNGHVALLLENIATLIGQMPACKAHNERDNEAAEAVFDQYRASNRDQVAFDRYDALLTAADTNFRHCFGAAIVSRPEYLALVKQAQALAGRAASW